ncbi:MAG: chromate transporter, partial [Bacillus sp. (in: firmicutes)]
MIFIQLFYRFFMTGLFSIGGGLATLPFLYEMAEETDWFTQADVANMLAVSESTPGAIGVNMASYVGFITAGIPGSLVATLALVMPSVIIILTIAHFMKQFKENALVDSAFYGLRAASTGLIAAAGLEVCRISLLHSSTASGLLQLFNWKNILIAVFLFVLMEKYKKHPVFYIAIA